MVHARIGRAGDELQKVLTPLLGDVDGVEELAPFDQFVVVAREQLQGGVLDIDSEVQQHRYRTPRS